MADNKRLYNSTIISLLVHALLIYLIPKITLSKPEEKIGSYTSVQLIHTSSRPPAKKEVTPAPKEAPPPPKKESKVEPPRPEPKMDPVVRDQMKTVGDLPIPSFELPWSQPDEVSASTGPEAELKDDAVDRLEDEIMDQQAQPSPVPEPAEIMAKREDDVPAPVPDELEFDPEEPIEEADENKDVPPMNADIKWSGTPRNILYKPDKPPRYPEGYRDQTQGGVKLKFWVDRQGEVVRAVPIRKLDPRLDAVATDYLRQYRFEPVSKDRRNELQWGTILFHFSLE
jgi:TonB family protein